MRRTLIAAAITISMTAVLWLPSIAEAGNRLP
jgi:hypothetical protein